MVPPYRRCTPVRFLFRKNSQKTITGLAKLQVFASHPFRSDSEACPVVSFAVLYGVKLGVGAPSARLIENFCEHSETKNPMSGQSL